jgi:hypothetical protein
MLSPFLPPRYRVPGTIGSPFVIVTFSAVGVTEGMIGVTEGMIGLTLLIP